MDRLSRRSVLLGGAAAASAPAPPAAAQERTLLNVSYDPTREFYRDVNAAFAAARRDAAKETVRVRMSHGGSGRQARAVMDGLEADVVTLALGHDVGGVERVARPHRLREHAGREAEVNPMNYIYLAIVLFTIGSATVLLRRNAIIVFMGVELMLNAANLAFVTFARMHGSVEGQAIALFVMVVAAAEVVVGLAIIMAIYRARRSASVDDANLLKL